MVSDKKLANAVSGKTARACDSCIRKRARWYCAADDAFLCEACDSSVHSANPLARRHERVRLKMASFKQPSAPSWHHGFTRKARTPRSGKNQKKPKPEEQTGNPILHLVPEMGSDEMGYEETEDQLLYRVPIFDPFAEDSGGSGKAHDQFVDQTAALSGFFPSEMDLEDFAADVESLLGKGLDGESFDMEELGFSGSTEKGSVACSPDKGEVKVEDGEEEEEQQQQPRIGMENGFDMDIDLTREPFELTFEFDSLANCEEEEKCLSRCGSKESSQEESKIEVEKKKILLRLDYKGVMTAWDDQKSPWMTGERPELDVNDCWPDCMGGCGTIHNPYGGVGGYSAMADGGREARVSRYREKRRTRLFSKKIRYEVRKLNAEKRPRMKGRFVKRTNFAGGAAGFPLLGK